MDKLSYNNISENVEAVSANGKEASDTSIDLSDAEILCIACPISCANVNTSRDFPVKFTSTYGGIVGDGVLQNAPDAFPSRIAESTCLCMNTRLAYSDKIGLNFASDSKTSLMDLSYEYVFSFVLDFLGA